MSAALFLVGWLLSRLALINDQPLGKPALSIVAASQAAVSFIAFGVTAGAAVAALIALLLLFCHERWLSRWLLEARFLSAVVMIGLVLGAEAAGLAPAEAWLPIPAQWRDGVWIGIGLLLVANEINFVIRLLFRVFDLEPRQHHGAGATSGDLDERAYNAGRVIGILERWLMYSVLVVSDEYAVIAVVVAAKGFARFRQLDQREFAEYVLIGTLASTLFTIWVARAIRLGLG